MNATSLHRRPTQAGHATKTGMPRAARSSLVRPDPTVYPESDDMGENTLETFVRMVLLALVERYLAARGFRGLVSSNQFIYWEQFNPRRCVAPDLYVIPGLPPQAELSCIKTWEGDDLVPTFALEIVSVDKGKDYDRSPVRYADLGARELVIYDPKWKKRRNGLRWQAYRWVKRRGFLRVDATNEDRIFSKELGCWLRVVKQGTGLRVRLGEGPNGQRLVPTESEEREAAQQAAELAQREKEAAQQAAELAQREKEAAQQQAEAAQQQVKVAQREKEAAQQQVEAEQRKKEAADLAYAARVQELEAEVMRLRQPHR